MKCLAVRLFGEIAAEATEEEGLEAFAHRNLFVADFHVCAATMAHVAEIHDV